MRGRAPWLRHQQCFRLGFHLGDVEGYSTVDCRRNEGQQQAIRQLPENEQDDVLETAF
jgi:hypothetical protein